MATTVEAPAADQAVRSDLPRPTTVPGASAGRLLTSIPTPFGAVVVTECEGPDGRPALRLWQPAAWQPAAPEHGKVRLDLDAVMALLDAGGKWCAEELDDRLAEAAVPVKLAAAEFAAGLRAATTAAEEQDQ